MTGEWFDIVAVRFSEHGKIKLFQAPGFSGIKWGEGVIVESGIHDVEFGKAEGVAVTVNQVYPGHSLLETLLAHCEQEMPLPKIISRIEVIDMKYPEEVEADGDNTGDA